MFNQRIAKPVASDTHSLVDLPTPDLGLKASDPEMASLLEEEINRQKNCKKLIAQIEIVYQLLIFFSDYSDRCREFNLKGRDADRRIGSFEQKQRRLPWT